MSQRLLFIALFLSTVSVAQIAQKRTVKLMGSRFDITIVANDKATANAYIDTAIVEISRIENLISDWIPTSQVSEINQNAGIRRVQVDPELFELTSRAVHYSRISNGAFDISYASMDKIWKFDDSMTQIPSAEAIKKSVEKIGYKNIVLDSIHHTIYLKLTGMKIGFGSIGKGYAADKTKELLLKKGIKAGIINASGDLNSWGKQPNGKKWQTGITNPFDPEEIFTTFKLNNSAVVTSGTYGKFVVLEGKKYAHIIDPRTGYPATGLASVTVFSESAELANGLSTAVIVLGQVAGINLLQQNPNIDYVIINDQGNIFSSKRRWFQKKKLIKKQ